MAKRKFNKGGEVRLVAYYRYSGGSGQTEQSIEGQRRDCETYARLHNMTIQKEYVDRHISGKTDDRAAFQQMITDSDKGAFDMVICWKTDRFARNRYDSAVYKKRLRDNGVEIVYAAESNIAGAEGIIIEGVMEALAEYYSAELAEKISKYARVKLDDSDNAPGWKFSQWEMKGVPLRLEIGPKDLEKNQCVLVRRDTREKVFVSLDELETAIPAQLEALRKDLYERALANREKRTWAATTMDEVKELAKANTGYIKTMWCGDLACEMKMKEEVGLSSRCMPFEQEHLSDVCPCCGKPAKTMVYWGVAY